MADLMERVDGRLAGGKAVVAQIDMIAVSQTLDDVGAGAGPDHELVVAAAAVEPVLAGATEEVVIAPAAMQVVVAFAADQGVVAAIAEQLVIAVAAVEQVIAAAAVQYVMSLSPKIRSLPGRKQHVVTIAAVDRILPRPRTPSFPCRPRCCRRR